MKREHLLKIGVSGIRGVVGEFLTPGLACAFAQAFGTYVGGGRVVVGRDTRASGPMLQHAVTCGLLASGCEVIDTGVLPTPTIQMYVNATRARGGIALTASHNPPEYNALKLFNAAGLFFNHYEREELLDIYHQSEFTQATNRQMQRVLTDFENPVRMHLARVLGKVDAERIRARRFRVALDGVNGAGSVVTPGFLRDKLGCELHAISIDPAQPFPRQAEPTAEVLGDLADLVCNNACDVGFAQDPDGDRLAICDERGKVLDNDDVLALVIDAVLARLPGDVVVNLTTSSVIDDVAAWHGRKVFRTPVGEANVVEGMLAHKAVIGGEGLNGGIIFPSVHYCRDSYTGMAFVLDRLCAEHTTVSELVSRLPRYVRRSGKRSFEHARLAPAILRLETVFDGAEIDRTDGLKISTPEGWVHVRPSNTEPVLRIAVEGRTEAAAERLFVRALATINSHA